MKYQGLTNVPVERAQVTFPWVTYDGAFSVEEIHQMCAYFDEVGVMRPGALHGGRTDEEVRRCDVAHFLWDERNAWVFDRLNEHIARINARWYGFDLNGYRAIQYAEYDAEETGHYDWHTDFNMGYPVGEQTQPRKLSIAMVLNEPGADFEGGEFHMNLGNPDKPAVLPIQKGRIIAFPSFMGHRVTPVTKGIRKSLVCWVEGPKFS